MPKIGEYKFRFSAFFMEKINFLYLFYVIQTGNILVPLIYG